MNSGGVAKPWVQGRIGMKKCMDLWYPSQQDLMLPCTWLRGRKRERQWEGVAARQLSSPSPGSIKPDRCTDAELSTPGALLDFMKDTEQNLLRFAFCISRVLKCLWSQICLYFLLQFLLILLNLKSPSHTLLTIHQRFDKYSLSFSSQFLMDYFLKTFNCWSQSFPKDAICILSDNVRWF